jgi:uncharacterized protein YdeI (YjbR/CyaY-like superfamily)
MGQKDPRVDEYIAKAADFARPILGHLRAVVHAACPDAGETIKWGFPHFEHKGLLCNMAAFKSHCAFGFWKGAVLAETHPELADGSPAMGQLGRIGSLADLPAEETLLLYVRDAAALNERGVKSPARSKPRTQERELAVPDDLLDALRQNEPARATFEGFSYSNKKEYVEWLAEAKSAETRRRRLEQAVEWMAEGKIRNWKYVRK